MAKSIFTTSATFLADARAFHARAAEYLVKSLRLKPCDDFDRGMAMEYERLARSAEDAAFLFDNLENTRPD